VQNCLIKKDTVFFYFKTLGDLRLRGGAPLRGRKVLEKKNLSGVNFRWCRWQCWAGDTVTMD